MTDLLIKLFIKDRDNVNSPKVRGAYGSLTSGVGIVINILLSALKLFAGLITSSLSVVADALNNLSDAASSVMLLVGFKLAGRRADSDHPFGHGRIEYITGLVISFLILLMGFELLKSSVSGIVKGSESTFSWISLIILAFSVLGKLWLWAFNRKVGKKINSEAIIAGSADSLSDCISTIAVLAGMVISHVTPLQLDAYIGCAVSLVIMYAGFKSAKETVSPLLGKAPDKEFVDTLYTLLVSEELVIDIHDLIVHDYGPGRLIASAHVEVPCDGDILVIHDAIDNLERRAQKELSCLLTLHMDPVDTNNPELPKVRELISGIVKGIDERYMFHDLRLVSGPTHTNVLFDIAVPAEDMKDAPAIEERVKKELSELNENYFAVIKVEQNF